MARIGLSLADASGWSELLRPAATSSAGCSSVFEGMQAQYVQSPPHELLLDERDRDLLVEPAKRGYEGLAG